MDPLSTEVLELGTREYPYRTMKSVSSEVLTFFSHQQVEITIYVKDVYLEDISHTTFYAVNMTEISFKSHPDYTELNRRAVVTLTELSQPGISQKARFHLLTSTALPIQEVIDAGNFMKREENQLLERASFIICRTGLTFESIDLYREVVDPLNNVVFAKGIYLQDKTFSLCKYPWFEVLMGV